MLNNEGAHNKGMLILLIALILLAAVIVGAIGGYSVVRSARAVFILCLFLLPGIPLLAFLLYKKTIFPYFRRIEDANLELHLKQEEVLDLKDDLFIKFLGIYDANYTANSPRLFPDRLKDVVDITARVMEADVCLIYLYDKKKDDLVLSAINRGPQSAVGTVRIPLGEGFEGWVARRLEPVMLRDLHADPRYREFPGFSYAEYTAIYCLPLYVYSNGALMGVMEVLFDTAKNFTDEEITFFTTLTGILSTTIQNEELQSELRKMNLELEQWVTEKTEELRASEERYRTLVENACESIFVLAPNGDIVFANDQAARLSGFGKYDLIHKNLFELLVDPTHPREILSEVEQGKQARRPGELSRADGSVVPVEVSGVGLQLMGKRFIQSVVRDMSSFAHLEKLIEEQRQEIAGLKKRIQS